MKELDIPLLKLNFFFKFSIAVRCAIDHPQQTLYQLFSLANAYADDPAVHKKTKEARVLGAAKILEQLKRDAKLMEVVAQMEVMCSSELSKLADD